MRFGRPNPPACDIFGGVEAAVLKGKLDMLAAMRGDPVKGLPPKEWHDALVEVDKEKILRALLEIVKTLLIPAWAERRKDDRRPQAALEATEQFLATKSPDALLAAKAAAKACTAARNETFGDDHRVPEAARAVAWAAGGKEDELYDGIACAEEELLARIQLTSEYHLMPQQRRAIVDTLRRMLLPPEKVETPAVSKAPTGPVPYSADGHFELGQTLIHKKFGNVSVVSVGETWIEVELPDATKKRLAHKP